MYIYITFAVLPVVANYITCGSTSDLPKEVQQKSTLKNSLKNFSSTPDPTANRQLPIYHHFTGKQQRQQTENIITRIYRPPLHVTKLAKTLSLTFEPYFSKHYFEPFERRSQPLTLVAFRKNGWEPKRVLRVDDDIDSTKPLEVAVQQSPYNSVGYFWQDEPGEPDN